LNKLRINKIFDTLHEHSADSALISNPADIFYLAGVKTSGILILQKEGAIIYVPSVSFEESKLRIKKDIECRVYSSDLPWDEISYMLKGMKVAVEPVNISLKTYNKIKNKFSGLVFIDELVARHRIIKEPEELGLIRKACSIATEIVDSISKDEWIGKTEMELTSYLEQQAWSHGCAGSAFVPVVATGQNSAYPHHEPGNDYIRGGWLKVDFGVVYDGYCSDLTRTFILDKFINNLDSEKLFVNLREAQSKAVELLRPGIECSKVYEVAKGQLEKCGLARYFIHGLGHGVGIEVHEKPDIKYGEPQKLQEGMVVTIEPGFYMPGTGGMRIEDTYLIKKEGAEKLTGIYQ
jgi:Xaa-Pro aminopeptidase